MQARTSHHDFEVLLIVGGEAVRVALRLAAGGRGLKFGGETGEGLVWVGYGLLREGGD